MTEALLIHVKGIVQGVGFRPFVYREAKKHLICGWVLNAADGVTIFAEGEAKLLDEFVLALSSDAPAASQVEEIDLKEVPLEGFTTFEIRYSDDAKVEETTLVSADLAICDECTRELFDPSNRRFRYPFINCTNCGPRFTIIDALPYDRAHTSMASFTMCNSCASEYKDPANRRFHAQPNACFECGPHATFSVAGEKELIGTTRKVSDEIFARATNMLIEGKILAIKGLGGFHLSCDAHNEQAIACLRARKHRGGKAFAVMMQSLDDIAQVCEISDAEAALLTSPAHPIVLLRKRKGASFAKGLADGLSELGVMLAYTPVQHILMHDFARAYAACIDGIAYDRGKNAHVPMLVMTSGNIHDEPITTDDEKAKLVLGDVADAFLGNNRAIYSRYDDSVLRVIRINAAGKENEAVQFIRRARGYAPVPLALQIEKLDSAGETIFAAGSEQKNTFTLLRGNDAFVSQHIGDMENAKTYDAYLEALASYEELFALSPGKLACDMHPEYISTKWAHKQAKDKNVTLEEVQHHHAHIASAMAENGLRGPVCGIAFDGTGYGVDKHIWGGEVLLANLETFERFANFAYIPMPGGAACIKHPLRMAYGALCAFDLLEHPAAKRALESLGEQAQVCAQMIEQSINTPMTSSVGRLFDAASALLGICTEPAYEGEPAILLEAAAWEQERAEVSLLGNDLGNSGNDFSNNLSNESGNNLNNDLDNSSPYVIDIVKNVATAQSTAKDTSVVLLDAAPLFKALLDDMQAKVPLSVIARNFHDAYTRAIVEISQLVRALYEIDTVALSGGVFMNRYILEHALARLEKAGFTVAINRDLPPNDGCISFGQAVVARARMKR